MVTSTWGQGVWKAGGAGQREHEGSVYDQDLNQGLRGAVTGSVMTLRHHMGWGLLTSIRKCDPTLGTGKAGTGSNLEPWTEERSGDRKPQTNKRENEKPLSQNECAK